MRQSQLQVHPVKFWSCGALLAIGTALAAAQSSASPQPASLPDDPHGQVLIESHGEPPAPGQVAPPRADPEQPIAGDGAKADITDAQRSALLITSYDLDLRIDLPQSLLSTRARLNVRNTGSAPLSQLALQLSSSLHWDSATLVQGAARTPLALSQHLLETDADHTGAESEAILPLPAPLVPGESVQLDLFYSGTITQNAGRLQRLGASAAQQDDSDWDAVTPGWTGVRGFGNVLWYPVASPQLFFADGNALFEAIGLTRQREEHAAIGLHLSVTYAGSAPAAAYFCGRRQTLKATADAPDEPTASGSGIATASFASEPLGFRTPSFFLLPLQESLLSASTTASASPSQGGAAASEPGSSDALLALETTDVSSGPALAAATGRVAPLLREWFGPKPLSVLTILDHNGQPFQDGPLLIAPAAVLETSPQSQLLIQSLTHAWVQTGQPWMDEGLAAFAGLLWTERNVGHEAANAQLMALTRPLALAEPATFPANAPIGQPLTDAYDEIYYRRKAAAVWWMLRGLVGDGNLHQAVAAWRLQPLSQAPAPEQAKQFETLLEHLSNKDLGWFFADWVLRDRGLPDLSITDLNAAAEPASPGHPGGWLVAVTVRNEGSAVADVPLIVRTGKTDPTEQRIRIPGLSTVTQRVLVESTPTFVQVNDGSTPEQRESQHSREMNLQVR